MANEKDLDFRPIPFYFLNDKVEKEEIELQMQRMQESGVSGFFLHARCGLQDYGYGNKKWYDDVEYIIQRAAAYGLEAWLYDEDAYPSGNAGGRIAIEHPEFIAQKLRVRKEGVIDGKCSILLGNCRPLKAYGVRRVGKTFTVQDLTEHFGVVRGDWFGREDAYCYMLGVEAKRHIRSAAYNPQISFYCEGLSSDTEVYIAYAARCVAPNRFNSLVDNINKDCVDLFKKYAYESYYQSLSEKALSNVRGMFTDEPVSGGMPPWTDTFEARFLELKGYAIQDNYFHIVENFNEFSSTVRRDYWQVAFTMFKENYIQNLHSFCKEKGIDFVGHFESEETPLYQSLKCVNVYEALWQLDHSGFDSISNGVGGRDDVCLSFGAKLASSVSVQKGGQRTLCECFGVNPFNFGLDGMKKMVGWAMAFGADTFVPHAFYYGYSGLRKYDAGKSFFFQDASFSEFKRFSDYVDRMAKRIHEGESASDTLLVYPNWEFVDYSFLGEEKYNPFAKRFFELFRTLLDMHVEFDITDCEYISKNFSGGEAKVGIKRYKNIVYLSNGSPVMAEILQKINSTSARVFDCSNGLAEIEGLAKCAFNTPLQTVKGDCRQVHTLHKLGKDKQIIFLYNANRANNVVKLATDKLAYVYDGDLDTYNKVQSEGGEITLSLEGFSLTCLVLRQAEIPTAGVYELKEYADKTYEYEANPDWIYTPPVPVKATVTHFDMAVKGKTRKEKFVKVKPCRVQKVFGVDPVARLACVNRPFHDDAPVYTEYPVECTYKATFNGAGVTKMLFEEQTFTGEYELYLNGKRVDKSGFIKERVYDFRNLVCDLSGLVKKGKNVLLIKFPKAAANDGLTGEIYFI